jgi:hypothetical protein
MRPIAHFALQVVTPVAADAPPHSRLLVDGQPVETTLLGACLDAQFVLDGRYLLIMTDDIPYEETMRVYLLNSAFDVVDRLELGAPYTPGILARLSVVAPDRLEFSFSGSDRWQLRIRETPLPWLQSLLSRAGRVHRVSSGRMMELTRVGPGS